MTDDRSTTQDTAGEAPAAEQPPAAPRARRRSASRPAGPPALDSPSTDGSSTDGPSTDGAGAEGASDAGSVATGDAAVAAPAAKRARATKTTKATSTAVKAAKKAAAKGTTATDDTLDVSLATETEPAQPDDAVAPVKRAARKRAVKKAVAAATDDAATTPVASDTTDAPTDDAAAAALAVEVADPAAPVKVTRKRATRGRTSAAPADADAQPQPEALDGAAGDTQEQRDERAAARVAAAILFQAPDPAAAPPRRRRRAEAPAGPAHVEPADTPDVSGGPLTPTTGEAAELPEPDEEQDQGGGQAGPDEHDDEQGGGRKRRRRGGRGRRRRGEGDAHDAAQPGADGQETSEGRGSTSESDADHDGEAHEGEDEHGDHGDDHEDEGSASSRRRRRRRRRASGNGNGDGSGSDDPPGTVTKVRQARKHDDEVASVKGSTRLEAKKQRRRDGREAGRRKQIITESEFLARRESVERTMIVRERSGRTQIAVLEDDVLVEHYVANETNTSMIGNVYLGRVQNVLPSMEAAFVDIGKGRNAVLYAGEVNWDAAGLEGQPRRIEQALKSGDTVLVQVTKDPLGHKGARLTSQISLPGRYLVYVPNSSMTGISRKLPDTERSRLKKILKAVVPEHAGVIVRTAAEGASEEELARDVTRLTAQWEDIEKKASSSAGGSAPKLLHGEPDLTIRVVRDVFNEDFTKLLVSGNGAWEVVQPYLQQVAPDLAERASRWTSEQDVFAAHRVDEQLAKAMDRKVYLPSGGSLVIDRTEAMTVVDVNTGKFTGSGGNLEETVTRNNLEAAEEIVRQLRLRDIGGIIVVDFIDMVLESNRDLVLRRLVECLGRDRTKHQVAEVTSLGLVQMTRKRVGQGLVEVFSEPCEHCNGRGIVIHSEPVSKNGNGTANGSGGGQAAASAGGSSGRSRRGKGGSGSSGGGSATTSAPTVSTVQPPRGPIPAGLVASLARHTEHHEDGDHHEGDHHEGDAHEGDAHEGDAQRDPGAGGQPQADHADRADHADHADRADHAVDDGHDGAPTPVTATLAQPASSQEQAAPQQQLPGEAAVAELSSGAEPAVPVTKPRRRRRASAPAGPPVSHDDSGPQAGVGRSV